MSETNIFQSNVWEEVEAESSAYRAQVCFCHGYDVYNEILPQASYIEYLYTLFIGHRPSAEQSRALELLAIAIANLGPRDPAINAAMNGGVAGSTAASCLMASLAVSAGNNGGAREVFHAVEKWRLTQGDALKWLADSDVHESEHSTIDIWPKRSHQIGIDLIDQQTSTLIKQSLSLLIQLSIMKVCINLDEQLSEGDKALSWVGFASAVFYDLGFSPEQAEMCWLLLRLPGAAIHALEQKELGWRQFPFYSDAVSLADDPGEQGVLPDVAALRSKS